MIGFDWLILVGGGLVSGILAGLLGIGGGTILVPLLITLGHTPLQSVATSSLVIVISSLSGSIQNWRMGYFDWKRVVYLGIPALFTAQAGVYLATQIPPYLLLFLLGIFLIANIYMIQLKKRLSRQKKSARPPVAAVRAPEKQMVAASVFVPAMSSHDRQLLDGDRNRETSAINDLTQEANHQATAAAQYRQTHRSMLLRALAGGGAGLLAGLLGMGGGAILVPFQILLLNEPIKVAIQTSLGVIVGTAVSACVGHAAAGNVLWLQGIILGAGGLLGSQLSTRVLPKLPDSTIDLIFRSFMGVMAVYIFWQASAQTDRQTFWLLVMLTVLAIAGILLIRFCVSWFSPLNRTHPSVPPLQRRTTPILALLLVVQSLALAWVYRSAIAQQWTSATQRVTTIANKIGQPKADSCLAPNSARGDQKDGDRKDYVQVCNAMQDILNVPSGQFFHGGTMGAAALRSKNFLNEIQIAHPGFRLRYLDPLNAPPDSTTGIKMLLDGELSFAESQRPLREREYQQAKDRGFTLKQIPVAMTGAAFYTHRDLHLPGLSVEQLQAIYLGKLTNWAAVGGPNLPITPISQDKDLTGSTLGLLLRNLASPRPTLATRIEQVRDTTAALRAVAKTPGAIGFGTQAIVAQQRSVRLLGVAKAGTNYIQAVSATGESNKTAIEDGTYPLIQRIFVVIRQDGTLDEMAGVAYANLLLSEKGQTLINQAGYLPLRLKSTENAALP
jgi:uncharacterized membrane protein YfcA/ABC-type phosphate transport system substrate-binding protein